MRSVRSLPSRVRSAPQGSLRVRANDPLIYIGDRRSPPYIYRGGRFARRVGIGSDLASPAPGGTGASPAPGGTGPTQFRLYERTYPPEGGERRSPIYIRGSYARTRRNFVRNFFDKGIVASYSVPDGLSWTTLYK